jgi:hypothetical protein
LLEGISRPDECAGESSSHDSKKSSQNYEKAAERTWEEIVDILPLRVDQVNGIAADEPPYQARFKIEPFCVTFSAAGHKIKSSVQSINCSDVSDSNQNTP